MRAPGVSIDRGALADQGRSRLMNAGNVPYLTALLTRRLPLQTLDASRMTLAFFGVAGLALLGALETALDGEQRAAIVEWVYAQQTPPRSEGGSTSRVFLRANAVMPAS